MGRTIFGIKLSTFQIIIIRSSVICINPSVLKFKIRICFAKDVQVIIALLIHTVYGWATGTYDTNYVFLASSAATYCATVAIYEEMKKKEAKKKQE